MDMSWKYSITLSSFKNLEPLQKTLENLKQQGFNTVEVYGEPDLIDVKNVSSLLHSFSMEVSGITGIWGLRGGENSSRNIITTNYDSLIGTQNYVKSCILLCHALGGRTFNVCLFSDTPLISNANHKNLSRDQKRKLVSPLIEPLRELAKYAKNYGVDLLIEPLNRYSTPICTDSEDAKNIVKLLNQENVGILLDTFHMNIEEDSLYDAVLNTRTQLKHVHISDNNRKMPGFAHVDFATIIKALKKINYSKFLTFEPTVKNTDYENDIKLGLQYIKNFSRD